MSTNWRKSFEYHRILEILEDYWLSQPNEETVEVTLYFKHKNGEEQRKTIKWTNPNEV